MANLTYATYARFAISASMNTTSASWLHLNLPSRGVNGRPPEVSRGAAIRTPGVAIDGSAVKRTILLRE